jgi:N-acyl-D-aspartate/D-glutamate deacylase
MLDVLIRGGTLVDGSGNAPRRADLGIRGGAVAAIGDVRERARRTVDAGDLVVAPGFVDIHTHYDAQVFWDPQLSPSPLHGVTTVVGGNCGFSVAPLTDESADYVMRMLATVEAMPLPSLREGVPWDWRSFGDYLQRLDGRLAVNAGFLAGHSAIRRAVMAERSGEPASREDLQRMRATLAACLGAGALGFSSSLAPSHSDGDGGPVPSRAADPEELLALCRVVGEFPGTTLEFIATVSTFTEEEKTLLAEMSLAADRPLNWNVLVPDPRNPAALETQLSASDVAAERGARVVALTPPMLMRLRLNLESGFLFDLLPGWKQVLALPIDERMRALREPAVRRRLAEGAASDGAALIRFIADWPALRVVETFEAANARWQGATVGDLCEATGAEPFDAFLDLALTEGLRTSFMPPAVGDDDEGWRLRARLWHDDRAVVGGSDAGAHLDMIDTFMYPTVLLSEGVRERGLIGLSQAVRQLTDVPARLYGLRGRGRLEEGARADLLLFDPERVAPGPVHTRRDLPAGAARLYAEAQGIERVFVNGVEIAREGRFTGERPGSILRSGKDTDTVTVPGNAGP